ncbi:MAG TPA: DUF4249 domain-containing protein [Bacteroidales bacterium]|jgi:hypothetical protein|nr:DUF4249 domain-containing protein [Bacteroidales bacterium]
MKFSVDINIRKVPFIWNVGIAMIILSAGCVALYTPEITETTDLLVVRGTITDQGGKDTIKLSRSYPVGNVRDARPVGGANVSISDNLGNVIRLLEASMGNYVTPDGFSGITGRFYRLHISGIRDKTYESDPMEMRPVPPIDCVYYNRIVIDPPDEFFKGNDACQVYLDTHDPSGNCRWFRWSFTETWMFRLDFDVPNKICWINANSHDINIKSTSAYSGSVIERQPVKYISNTSDRLKLRYSILVNQFSLNEDEYLYWEKVRNIVTNTGGLYDMIPAALPNNLRCIQDPDETVLGYFSVSAKTSKRIFIQDEFAGIIDAYSNCIEGNTSNNQRPPSDKPFWVLLKHPCSLPCIPYFDYTTREECADCTLRGSNKRPDFWTDK